MVTHHLLSPLRPPRSANSTDGPLVRFSLACGNISKTAVSFDNSFIHLPSFLPSFLSLLPTPSTSPSSHLPHRRTIDTHKETAHMSGGQETTWRTQHMTKSWYWRSWRINREAYINQTNTPCSPLPPLAPPIQRILSAKPVRDVARRNDPWGTSFLYFSIIILHYLNLIFIFMYLISFLFFSFLFFSFLFFSFLFFSFLFCSVLFVCFD